MEITEFDRLLAEKRHKELITILTKLVSTLSKAQSQPDIVVDTTNIEKVLKSLENSSKDEKLPSSIKAIGDVIAKKLDNINKPTQWEFNIERDKKGLIKTVKAKSKA